MKPYVMAEDLYQHKLALILGRGKRLKNIMHEFPTEKKFKSASIEDVAKIIGIKNPNSGILKKLQELDDTYDQMVTFQASTTWSKKPRAQKIMGIDTEYLKSKLDCIQYVMIEGTTYISSGIIFTNDRIARSVDIVKGINIMRTEIEEFQPDIIVGHNFNSDISILENAYGDELPELYFYDDTMDLLAMSNLANIIGTSSLNESIKKVLNIDVIGLFSAYSSLDLLVEYGIKDALFPIYLRYYIIHGRLPEVDYVLDVGKIIKEENRSLIKSDRFSIVIKDREDYYV